MIKLIKRWATLEPDQIKIINSDGIGVDVWLSNDFEFSIDKKDPTYTEPDYSYFVLQAMVSRAIEARGWGWTVELDARPDTLSKYKMKAKGLILRPNKIKKMLPLRVFCICADPAEALLTAYVNALTADKS